MVRVLCLAKRVKQKKKHETNLIRYFATCLLKNLALSSVSMLICNSSWYAKVMLHTDHLFNGLIHHIRLVKWNENYSQPLPVCRSTANSAGYLIFIFISILHEHENNKSRVFRPFVQLFKNCTRWCVQHHIEFQFNKNEKGHVLICFGRHITELCLSELNLSSHFFWGIFAFN